MAGTAISSEQIASQLGISMHDHDPGGVTATLVAADGGTTPVVVDMRDYKALGIMAMPSVGTSVSITKLEIVASALSTMASAEVIKDSGTIAADAALNDYAYVECTAEEVAQIGSDTGKELRYCAGRITQGGNADNEAVVTYIRMGPRFPRSGLTAQRIT